MRPGNREHVSHVAMHTPRTPLHLGRPARVQRYSSGMHRAMEEDSLMIWCCCLPTPMPLASGGVRCSRLWSTSQLLRPSGQQCSHSGGVCPQIQCGAYVGAVEEMMCVVCVDVTEGA